MGIRELDWSTAEVSDKRTLTVVLAGDSDEHWCEEFTAVARLLDSASHNHLWGEAAAAATAVSETAAREQQNDDDDEQDREHGHLPRPDRFGSCIASAT
jgi:hypothetical protein